MRIDYTVTTAKSYDQAVAAVVERTGANGFRVQHVHDVAATLAEKGFDREPVSIVEVCNAKFASQVLSRDINIGLMLPCPVMVYERDGAVLIATMKPTLIGGFFPDAELDEIAGQVEEIVKRIVDEAAA